MTPEERKRYLTLKKRQLELERDRAMSMQPQPQAQAQAQDEGGNWYDAPRQVLQGMTLNASDEIGAAIAATMAKATGDDTPWKDIYGDIQGTLGHERKVFEKANPKTAMALQLAGSLATPLKPLQAAKGGLLARGAQTGARMAAEGGAAGFMGAEGGLEDRLTGAAKGAGTSVALGGTLSGLGKLGKGLTGRRVDADLGRGEDFIPLNLADPEGGLGNFMRSVVGKAYGGGKVKEQTDRVLKKAADKLSRTENVLSRKKANRLNLATKMKAQAGDAFDESVDALDDKVVSGIASSKNTFRQDALGATLPAHAPAELREQLAGMNPVQANNAMRQYWTNNGFQAVKSRNFDIDADDIIGGARNEIKGDAPLADFWPEINSIFESKLTSKIAKPAAPKLRDPTIYGAQAAQSVPNKGTINGTDLMDARNEMRSLASQIRPEEKAATMRKAALNKAANKIDDQIKKSLSPEDLATYNDELSRWGAARVYSDAVERASTSKFGEFDATDWMNSVKKVQKGKIGRGEGVMQDAAQDSQRFIQGLESGAKDEVRVLKKAKKSAIDKASKYGKEDVAPTLAKALKQQKDLMVDLKKGAIRGNPSTFEKIFATSLLSLPVKGLNVAALPVTLPFGMAVAKGFSTEGAQRMLAGQTLPQELANKAIKSDTAGALSGALRRYTAGEVAE